MKEKGLVSSFLLLLATAHFAGLASAILCYNCGSIAVDCTYSNSTLAFECTVPMETLNTCGTNETLDSDDSVCGILLFTNIGFPQPAAVDTYLVHIGLLTEEGKEELRTASPTCDTTFSNRNDFLRQKNIVNCLCNGDFCNSRFRVFIGESDSNTSSPSPSPSPSPTEEPSPPTLPPKGLTSNEIAAIIIGMIIVALFIAAVVMVVVIAYLFVHGKRDKTVPVDSAECYDPHTMEAMFYPSIPGEKQGVIKEDQKICISGNDITVSVLVGRGRFGTVWRVDHKERGALAMKVFSYKDKPSWQNERNIYSLSTTIHPNILKYHSSDAYLCKEDETKNLYFMLTNYFRHGSLNGYLSEHTVTWEFMITALKCLAASVAHLHADQYNDESGSLATKHPIAHRDIKSSNVLLVSSKGDCVLSDFGLALQLDPALKPTELANSGQVGTYRYMSPEALDAHINLTSLESFKQIDVYALGLVWWEVVSRCQTSEVTPSEAYQLPFWDVVGDRPTLDAMKDAVVSMQRRPTLTDKWKTIEELKVISETIEECWDADPSARPTAAAMLQRMEALQNEMTIKRTQTTGSDCSSTNSDDLSKSSGSIPPSTELMSLMEKELS